MTPFCFYSLFLAILHSTNHSILDGEIIEEEINQPANGTRDNDVDMESDAGRAIIMLRLYNATAASDIIVRAKAYEVLNYISTAKYLHLQTYAEQLVQRTIEGLKKEDNLVVHQILELWMSIAEMEVELDDANIPSHELVLTHAQELIPAILEVLPSRVSEVSYVEEIVSPPKSVFTAAILTLWLLVDVLPDSTCMHLMTPFVGKYIPSGQDWRLRKSAIAVLGLLSSLDEAETLVRSCVGLVIEAGMSSLGLSYKPTGSASSSPTTSAAASSETSTAVEHNFSLSDSAAFCILQISELKAHLLEDRWEAIVQWMGALDVSNKSDFIILSSLIDASVSFILFSDEEMDVETSLLPSLGQILSLYSKWTARKEVLQFPRQLTSMCNGLETITDLFGDDNQLEPHKSTLEAISRNLLELLETDSTAPLTPQVTMSLLGSFGINTVNAASFETVKRLVEVCLKRGNNSTHFEELQEVLLTLICVVAPLQEADVSIETTTPIIASICDFILKILREATFGADDETSLIPVSEIRPQDEEEDALEALEIEEDYLGAKPESKMSKRSASGRLVSSTSRSKLASDSDPAVATPSTPGSTHHTPVKRKERLVQVHKSKKIAAKNVVLEDCLRLIETTMDSVAPEAIGNYSKELQVTLLEFALKVPSSFVSLLSTLALSLSSIMRHNADLVDPSLRPLLKLIEQITKTIAGDDTQQTVYHALMTAFQSAIVCTDESRPSHMAPLHESFEMLLTLLKQATKSEDDEEPDETALSDSVSLIGDYLSRVCSSNPRQIDDERIARLRSAFEMILSKWLDPSTEVVEYTLSFFEPPPQSSQ